MNLQAANLRTDGPAISGSFHSATKKGAAAVLREANDALQIGYDLVGVEKIEKDTVLFVLYRKRPQQSPAQKRGEASLTGD